MCAMTSLTLLRRLVLCPSFLVLFISILELRSSKGDSSYDNVDTLARKIIGNPRNNPELRPLRNQLDTMTVSFFFSLVSIVEVHDLSQTMSILGFMNFYWKDEMVGWNTSEYGGVESLITTSTNVWRPRLMLVNTVRNIDPFKDMMSAALIVRHTGITTWVPGGLLATSCPLYLENYPFDTQSCYVRFCTNGELNSTLKFDAPSPIVDLTHFIPNRGWDLVNATIYVEDEPILFGKAHSSCPTIKLEITRRPIFPVLYVILPVLLLSFLNLLVFIIPAESGEKISYGITVLLALSLFMGTISSLLPQASDSVPAITLYLFSLVVGSVLAVAVSIITVVLRQREERSKSQENKEIDKGTELTTAHTNASFNSRDHEPIQVTENNGNATNLSESVSQSQPGARSCVSLKFVNRYIDNVSLGVLLCLWLGSTATFFVHVLAL